MITDDTNLEYKIDKIRKSKLNSAVNSASECKFHDESSVEKYVKKADKFAQKLIKMQKFVLAESFLNQVYSDLTSKVSRLYNDEKIKILNTRAELKFAQNDAKASLEDLRLCYRLAVTKDQSKLKLGELLINMAQASG